MKVNNKKTKLMLFNNCKKWNFMPELRLDGHDMVLEEEMRLLGVVIRSDMKWSSNTENLVKKGFDRVWIMRRLKKLGATTDELKDVYIKQIRSILEFAVPAWHPALPALRELILKEYRKQLLMLFLGWSTEHITQPWNYLTLKHLRLEGLNCVSHLPPSLPRMSSIKIGLN